jgi:hypothetical protein
MTDQLTSSKVCAIDALTRIVLVQSERLTGEARLNVAAQFYGLHLEAVAQSTAGMSAELLQMLHAENTVAAAVSAEVLPLLPCRDLLDALRRRDAESIPLLIFDISPGTSQQRLREWCGDQTPKLSPRETELVVTSWRCGDSSEILHELSNESLPAIAAPACTFRTHPKGALLSIESEFGAQSFFTWNGDARHRIFYLSALEDVPDRSLPRLHSSVKHFMRLAPMMIFVRYAGGERCWHAPKRFANLTIDDPWLRSRYGHLEFEKLLAEMLAIKFHTTVAFIPWNYARSDEVTTKIFREHPELFSVCIHGNNHVHGEFADYKTTPLAEQASDIYEALHRMDEFARQTGVNFDRVMIFPEEKLSPAATLEVMERAGYLGTANAELVAAGEGRPSDSMFYLRLAQTGGTTLPRVRRFPAEVGVPQAYLAVQSFLENPLLFYGHHSLFEGGSDAFRTVVSRVREKWPDVKWTRLGEIFQHLYRLRVRGDGDYDVLAEGGNLIVENPSDRLATFHIRKAVFAGQRIQSVHVNGEAVDYRNEGGVLQLALRMEAGDAARLNVNYDSSEVFVTSRAARKKIRAAIQRRLSDLRDLVLSQNVLGRRLVGLYYRGRSG